MAWASTGISGLDKILCDLQKGDNVVWQVNSIEEYKHFVKPYVAKAKQDKRKIAYMRFAKHDPIIEDTKGINVYELNAESGFENFAAQVHRIISKEGFEAYYVFDCLSDLLSSWSTDLMVGNFFCVTCPYLFELDTIAYFALLRNRHSYKTVARIRGTTQLLLDVFHFENKYYVHPLKVWDRYSPTMFLPHCQEGETFSPVVRSVDATKLFSQISETLVDESVRVLDHWDRLFIDIEKLLTENKDPEKITDAVQYICDIMIGKEQRISELANEYFSLEDLLNIKSRLLGSGYIGGKTAGMLIAQNILRKDKTFAWDKYLEPHDSYYIGSDIYYTYIVENGWWKLFMQQKTDEGYFEAAKELNKKMLNGKFPDEIRERFRQMIEYFGQSPIIVRSSSLLEDSFGNAFAGKYESIFLPNQGDPDVRYQEFEKAVKQVYASTMGAEALSYRLARGLAKHDEQMALLVQRVSGSRHQQYFFPDLAGVGVSYNTFVWHRSLKPEAGMIRLVFGLGTRAVDRVEDDYPQIIALDNPLLRPYAGAEDERRFSQHNVDLIDTKDNCFTTVDLRGILNELDIKPELLATADTETEQRIRELGMKPERAWIMTFKKLVSETEFTKIMQSILKNIEKHYHYPVDVEFTINFDQENNFRINLVQCRPLQTKGLRANVKLPTDIKKEQILFKSAGHTMGGSISQEIKKIIYIEPKNYLALNLSEKYETARIVGKLNTMIESKEDTPTILIGPGRWGTTTPSLGVPVNFSEINKITAMVEIAYEGGNLMPELSFGTHFFQDLVESDIFYIALFSEKEGVDFNHNKLDTLPNKLTDFVPNTQKYNNVVKVYETTGKSLQIACDVVTQKVICYFAK